MQQRARPWAAALALAGIGLLAVGAVVLDDDAPKTAALDPRPQEQRFLPAPASRVARLVTAPKTAPVRRERREEPRPVRILIPAIRVSAPVIPLGLNADRTMQVPTSFSDAGWFRPGPEPGEVGAAVIAGHVDSKSGPGVFYRLRALRRVVTSTRDVSKQRFPTHLVFRQTQRRTLRLITCGGLFNTSTGHYVDNHIVFAWLLGKP
jgi:hypothetical protein